MFYQLPGRPLSSQPETNYIITKSPPSDNLALTFNFISLVMLDLHIKTLESHHSTPYGTFILRTIENAFILPGREGKVLE